MANALTKIKADALTADLIDETKLADNSIDSEHYNDGSIDHAHLADDAVDGDIIADNAVGLAHMAGGTDGVIITYDASGNPVHVGPGNDGQVLTSTGAGSPPAFEDVPAGGATINNATANELVTVASTTTQLDAEANLTFDGNHLTLGDGDLVIGTAGHGISFAATGDGSGTDTSELLDDYEEGEWTPVINTGAGAVTSYATERHGRYTRVGNICHVTFSVKGAADSGLASGSGDIWISGLPYNMYAHPHASIPRFVYLEPDTDSSYTVYWITAEYYSDKMYVYGKANSGGMTNMGGNLSAQSIVLCSTTFRLA